MRMRPHRRGQVPVGLHHPGGPVVEARGMATPVHALDHAIRVASPVGGPGG